MIDLLVESTLGAKYWWRVTLSANIWSAAVSGYRIVPITVPVAAASSNHDR